MKKTKLEYLILYNYSQNNGSEFKNGLKTQAKFFEHADRHILKIRSILTVNG